MRSNSRQTGGSWLRLIDTGSRSACTTFAPAHDGRALATWGECELVLWDLGTGRPRPLGGGHQGPVGALAVSPDGRLAATTCFGDVARLWDVATGRELRQFPGLGDEGTGG